MATAAPGYSRREATGPIEATHAGGVKIGGIWWSQSSRQPVDLSRYRVGDLVRVVASETADRERRFLLEIGLPAARAAPQFVDALPDDCDGLAERSYRADRLACLQIAAGMFAGWWVAKGIDPDSALVEALADRLVDWLYRTDRD